MAIFLGLLPFAVLLWDMATGGLGVEPVESLARRTGWWALALLTCTLAVTPIRRATGWNRLIQVRRSLGLLAFGYAVVHLLNYLILEQSLAIGYIVEDILERPLITAGFTAFLLLLPLALTSTRNSIRRLGRRWQTLHRLIYPAVLLGVLHYFWMVKIDTTKPLIFAGIVVALLLARVKFARSARKAVPAGLEARPGRLARR